MNGQPLGRRLGGPQSRSGRGGEDKNSQPLLGLEPPTSQPVARPLHIQRYHSQATQVVCAVCGYMEWALNGATPMLSVLSRNALACRTRLCSCHSVLTTPTDVMRSVRCVSGSVHSGAVVCMQKKFLGRTHTSALY